VVVGVFKDGPFNVCPAVSEFWQLRNFYLRNVVVICAIKMFTITGRFSLFASPSFSEPKVRFKYSGGYGIPVLKSSLFPEVLFLAFLLPI